MKNTDPNAKRVWLAYGCLRCNLLHFEGSKLYKPHGMYVDRWGVREFTAEERSQHLLASDQSVEETPQEDVRNALMLLATAQVDEAGRRELTADEYTRIGQRLQAAVAKLERLARQERPYRREP